MDFSCGNAVSVTSDMIPLDVESEQDSLPRGVVAASGAAAASDAESGAAEADPAAVNGDTKPQLRRESRETVLVTKV